MIKREKFIIIGSTGRNNGKTEFACKLIKQLSKEHLVIGVKVTTIKEDEAKCPRGEQGCGVCGSLTGSYKLTDETDKISQKDTARMLRSGAEKVLWLCVYKKSLLEGINELISKIPHNAVVVCESNSARLAIDPGLFIIIRKLSENFIKKSCKEVYDFADKIIESDGEKYDFSPERIRFDNNKWLLREKATAIILAGGKSIRMGEDKSMLQINGKPLISIISNQLLPYFDEVIIGANDSEKFKFLNLRVVHDIEKNKGPLMGILSCLKSSNSDLNFVTACDIPIMNIPYIKYMLNLAFNADIVMPVSENKRHETLYAIYNKCIINAAENILKDNKRRIIELFNMVNVTFVDINFDEWYQNLNTKQNYLNFMQRQFQTSTILKTG
ncbi:MAG: hypothetical protein A2X08_15605 [Bacteroidetes bacterium GWA2_32_17]|nr:MAG: hypothetical protein A2X08_15605 [Bacteroidetes bacterium GWA2_32_17]